MLKLPIKGGGKLLSGPDRATYVVATIILLFFLSLIFGSQILGTT